MDIEKYNSKSIKIGISVAKNLLSDKSASSENQKEYISNVGASKETIETKISEEKETTASLISLESDKDSSNFRDTSPDIIENDEHLNDSREKKSYPVIDNSSKKRKNEENNINDVSNKKLKVCTLNRVKDIDEDQADKDTSMSILDTRVKSLYSRSPSLFDDSLNLDTQMYDILEQNVVDLSGLEDSNAFESKLNIANTLQKKSADPNGGSVQTCNENNSNARIRVDAAHLPLKNSVLSWDDDSWNDFAELPKKVIENNDHNIKKEISQGKIKDIVNTSASILRNMKAYAKNNKKDLRDTDVKKCTVTVKEKAPRKAKLLKISSAQSPVANVIVFRSERKISVDSNKSDSDDIFVTSQLFESPFSNSKSRTKSQLERRIHKIRSQKLAENTEKANNHVNSPKEEISNDAVKDSAKKMKLKLKEILPRDFGVGSVIYDSDDDAVVDSKPISTIQRHETQLSVSKQKVKPKIEIARPDNNVELLSETIDWNTLNIVKVANNRATFSLFKREVLKKRSFALALHCDTYVDHANNIGSKICVTDTEKKRKSKKSVSYTYGRKEIRGAAISWERNIAYYISFNNNAQGKINKNFDLYYYNVIK